VREAPSNSARKAYIWKEAVIPLTILLGIPMGTSGFIFQPIAVNANSPGGACVLRTFDDIGSFILTNVDVRRRKAAHWVAVRQNLMQARFGARRAEVHKAMRDALMEEGWLG
jgi:hypothetical protein